MRSFLFSVFILSILFVSCKKDQATIHGKVTYMDTVANEEKAVDSVTIYLYEGTAIGGDHYRSTTSTADGAYAFRTLEDNHYSVYAETRINGILYSVQQTGFLAEKDNMVEIPLLLKKQ